MRWISGSMAMALAACTPAMQDSSAASAPPDTAKTDVLDSISNLVDDETPEQLDWRQNFPTWYAPVTPYRIIGSGNTGIYYVGTEGLGIYFIPTSAGHIVIDGGMPGEGHMSPTRSASWALTRRTSGSCSTATPISTIAAASPS